MSLNAATIEILIAKGLTAEDLLEVAKATEIKADRTNAERQARYRSRHSSNAVTVTVRPPKENISNPLSEPNGSGAKPPDQSKELWERAIAMLIASGQTEKGSRALMGKWCKAHGEPRTREIVDAAAGKADPIAYAQAAFARPGNDLDILMASVERKYAAAPP